MFLNRSSDISLFWISMSPLVQLLLYTFQLIAVYWSMLSMVREWVSSIDNKINWPDFGDFLKNKKKEVEQKGSEMPIILISISKLIWIHHFI